MSKLCLHISHLLWQDGQVSVPSFGVFRLVDTVAVASEKAISAPGRRVLFEPLAAADAYALVASVCRRECMSESEARSYVYAELASMESEIEAGKRLFIPRVGAISLDDSGRELLFESSVKANPLPLLDITPLVAENTQPEKIDAVAETLKSRREEFERMLRRTASSAAAIAMFAIVAFIVAQLPATKNVRQEATMAVRPFEPTMTEEEHPSAPVNSEPALVLILNTPSDATAPAKKRFKGSVRDEQSDAVGRYCLVVASLASEAEAQSYIKAHSTTDMPLRLLAEDGRWRVFALSGASFDEVSAVARNLDIYKHYPSAWICRR